MYKMTSNRRLLSRNLVEDYKSMSDLFPDESILNIEVKEEYPNWCMYFDRAANVHGSGINAILVSSAGAHFLVAKKLRFSCTNNTAEYTTRKIGNTMKYTDSNMPVDKSNK